MSDKILFIYNTGSGNHDLGEDEIITKIESVLKPSQTLTVLKIDKKQQGNESLVRSLIKEDWELVIVGGGDGTVRRLVAVMVEENFNFPVAILPLGSANGLATCLGVNDMDIAIEVLRRPHYIDMDVLCINDKISLHLSDFGFNAGLVKKFDESDTRGMMAYFKGSLSEVFANKPHKFQVIIDGEETDVEARMLMIANGRMYGTGAVINPKGRLDDGKFEIIAFNPKGLNEVFNLSLNLVKGEIDIDRQVRTWQVDNAIIKNEERAQFQIDGDMEKEVSEVRISVLKNRVKILVLALTKDSITAD